MNIFLIGPMGAGKTTIGKYLGQKLAYKFLDVDNEIEKKEKKTINDIFTENGESTFRSIESNVLRSIVSKDNQVVATGGGIVTRKENIDLMVEKGKIVYLNLSIETQLLRLKDDHKRPLLKESTDIRTTLKNLNKKRNAIYQSIANFSVSSEGDHNNVVNKIINKLSE
tara:strand:- start:5520 stop:6023 length:504 start_codon:yes stop_codon:yes gene_type:complete